ncbi:hypothetical protein LTR53_005762 [Teratosphaeriaceae sp. CCFEE 6253]|nr:hypothetical protein LTR53_005762 [Teratosphaeriaceae sp. CCFEE 6253]
MSYIDSGSLHYIEVLSYTKGFEFLVSFRHEIPEDFSFGPPERGHQNGFLPEGGKTPNVFCICFDRPAPQDVGHNASAMAMPHEAMAASPGVSRKDMRKLEGTLADPLIVAR